MAEIEKRLPAEWTKRLEQQLTFLNDKKIDAELYAYLLSISYGEKSGTTITYFKDIPKQTDLCKIVGIKSRTTLNNHLKYLIDRGYLEKTDTGYVFLNPDEIYYGVPLNTLKFLRDCLTPNVIKAFVVFGQWWKYSQKIGHPYSFTKNELAKTIGISINNNARTYEMLNHIIGMLQLCNFIEIQEYYEDNKPRYRLVNFSNQCPVKSYKELSNKK